MKKKLLSNLSKFSKKINSTVSHAISTASSTLLNPDPNLTKNLSQITTLLTKPSQLPQSPNPYYSKPLLLPSTPPILLIAVVTFHHKKGSIIEFTYPPQSELLSNPQTLSYLQSLSPSLTPFQTLETILTQLTYLCLPDGTHSTNKDSQYFLIQNLNKLLYGISTYEQLQTTSLIKEDDNENLRQCVQKSMCIVSTLPLFGLLKPKLELTMSAYFNQQSLKDKTIIAELYGNSDISKYNNVEISEIYEGLSLCNVISFTKEKIFELIKLLLLEKNILVFSSLACNVCSFIFSLLSIFPGGVLFDMTYGKKVSLYNQCYDKHGCPLKLFHSKRKLYTVFSLYEIDSITTSDSFLLGTTNLIFITHPKFKYDCIINLDEGSITYPNDKQNKLQSIIKCTKYERTIYDVALYKQYQQVIMKGNNYRSKGDEYDNADTDDEDTVNYSLIETYEDGIRKEIKKYLLSFLSDIALCEYISSNNDISMLKTALSLYNSDFIIEYLHTINYMHFKHEHSSSLYMLSKQLKHSPYDVVIHYENGYIYTGRLQNGLRHGKGCLESKEDNYIYEGDWCDDKKEGKGRLFNDGTNYSGEFKNDQPEGNGTYIDNKGDMYEGMFMCGKLEGMGHLIKKNGDQYVGMFIKGVMEGKGQYTYKDDKRLYDGEFVNGEMTGKGVILYSNGDRYEGEVVSGKRNGKGVLYKDNDTYKEEGIWKDDVIITINE